MHTYSKTFKSNSVSKLNPMKTFIRKVFCGLVLFAGASCAKAQIIYSNPVLTNIVVTPANPAIGIGSNQQFIATGFYNNGSSQVLTNASGTSGVWGALAGMPAAKVGSSSAGVNGQLYVTGGGDPNLYAYYSNLNSWTNRASFINPWCAYSAAASISNKLYILGGCKYSDCSPGQNGGTEPWVSVYDLLANSWSNAAPMNIARCQMAVGVISGKIYVAGGFFTDDNGVEIFTDSLEEYDPASNVWTVKMAMPNPIADCGSAVINGKLYVVGGYSGGTNLNSMFAYDPTTDSWSTNKSMPTPRAYLGAAVFNGLLYAIDGNTATGSTNLVEVYNQASDSWSIGLPTLIAHVLPQPVVINGGIYIAGNGPGNSAITNVEAYMPQSSLWSSSNPTVASINTNGLANGLTNGMTIITAMSGGVSGTTTLTVVSSQLLLTNIIVSPANSLINAGSNQQFTAIGYYNNGASQLLTNGGGYNLLWTSSSAGIASINTNGLATGLTNGVSVITATSGPVSNITILTVVARPTITIQPTNNMVSPNGSVTLNVSATGGNLSYQWQFNGTNITGANSASFTITNVAPMNVGVYSVIVSNPAGALSSRAVIVGTTDIKMFAGIIVNGPLGSNYLVQAAGNFTNWTSLTNVALPTQPYIYIDYSSPTNRQRFYRAVPQ